MLLLIRSQLKRIQNISGPVPLLLLMLLAVSQGRCSRKDRAYRDRETESNISIKKSKMTNGSSPKTTVRRSASSGMRLGLTSPRSQSRRMSKIRLKPFYAVKIPTSSEGFCRIFRIENSGSGRVTKTYIGKGTLGNELVYGRKDPERYDLEWNDLAIIIKAKKCLGGRNCKYYYQVIDSSSKVIDAFNAGRKPNTVIFDARYVVSFWRVRGRLGMVLRFRVKDTKTGKQFEANTRSAPVINKLKIAYESYTMTKSVIRCFSLRKFIPKTLFVLPASVFDARMHWTNNGKLLVRSSGEKNAVVLGRFGCP